MVLKVYFVKGSQITSFMLKIHGLEQQLGPFYWPMKQQEKQPNFPTNLKEIKWYHYKRIDWEHILRSIYFMILPRYAVKDDEEMYQAAIIKGNVKCLFYLLFLISLHLVSMFIYTQCLVKFNCEISNNYVHAVGD